MLLPLNLKQKEIFRARQSLTLSYFSVIFCNYVFNSKQKHQNKWNSSQSLLETLYIEGTTKETPL